LEPNAVADAGRDFSMSGLIWHADPVVQAVMIALVLASVTCWAIIFEKIITLSSLGRQIRRLERAAASPGAAAQLDGELAAAMSAAVKIETAGVADGESTGELRSRIERAMRLVTRTELRRRESGLQFLATVGSTAPFVGLFGTVWGIMHSFTSIAQAKDTSLSVVAPGIAEALFATAIGLAAAIPAVIAYNQISGAFGRSAERIGAAVSGLARQSVAGIVRNSEAG
jgi:biopolymer transport protein ExbB/TolQ